MSGVRAVPGASAPVSADDAKRAQVRQLAEQLQGVFLAQLFEAMRRSVPQGGAIDPAPGQEMFTQIFDERIADQAAHHMKNGLSDALYRQLAARLQGANPTEAK